MPNYRTTWDCPACCVYKYGQKVEHLAARYDELAMAPYSNLLKQRAQRRNAGFLSISYALDPVGTIVAEPKALREVAEPQPVAYLFAQLLTRCLDNQVTRFSWSDLWRPSPDTDPLRWKVLNTNLSSYSAVIKALERAGYPDGYFGKTPWELVIERIEPLINGAAWNVGLNRD